MAEKEKVLTSTKGQHKRMLECGIGYGVIMFHSAENETCSIEFYVGKNNIIRRVGNGQPLFPLEVTEEDGETHEVRAG